MEDRYEIGKRIRKARQDKDLTQEQLADKIGYTKQTVSNWETGKSTPRYEDKYILSKELGIVWEREVKTSMHYKELMDLKTIEDVKSTVDSIIKYLNAESPYKNSINIMLNRIVLLLVAYYIYVEEPEWKREYEQYDEKPPFDYMPPDWSCLAEDIRSMLALRQGESIPGNKNAIAFENPLYETIYHWTSKMQIRLWDDHGEGEDHIMGFKQDLAELGLDSGYKLQGIMQRGEFENSFTTELRCALTGLQDLLCEV